MRAVLFPWGTEEASLALPVVGSRGTVGLSVALAVGGAVSLTFGVGLAEEPDSDSQRPG